MIRRAVFLGSKSFGLSMFQHIWRAVEGINWRIIHPNDNDDERSVIEEFRAEAENIGVPFKIVNSREEAAISLYQEAYDIGFVCGWYWLFNSSQVGNTAPPLYGIHHSALPRYRGGAPLVWAIINGEHSIGSTLFRITPGMDDGPIVAQVECNVAPEMNVNHVLKKLENEWSQNIGPVWCNLVSGRATLLPQEEENATYCAQRRPEDGRINWSNSAEYIHNFVRAQAFPYPGAFTTTSEGMRITIDGSTPFNTCYHALPGQILKRASNSILVGCGHRTALFVTSIREGELSMLNGRCLV